MKIASIFTGILILLASCTSKKEQAQNDITSAEKALYSDSTLTLNPARAAELLKNYTEYAEKYKNEPQSAEYLYKAGEVASALRDYGQSIELLQRVVVDYPKHERAPYALFLQAFIFETQLSDKPQAKKIYEEFLQKFPGHALARDAKASIETMDKTPEELVKMFEQQGEVQ
jgi:TolA-binding protein